VTATYIYNALGQRAERTGSAVPHGGTLDEYYDAFGNLALLSDLYNNYEASSADLRL
jgi:hypothetical protein